MERHTATELGRRPGLRQWLKQGGLALATVVAMVSATGGADAQDGGLVAPGAAVVTGFSGFVANEAPPEADPFDYLSINPEGPSAQVMDLSALGPQGELSEAPKTATIQAGQTGQVFGVALDNAPAPNIYVAATSAYGVSIFLPDGTSTIQRIRSGAPGAQFVPGQFGPPELGGGPGSIWRVDGTTGEVLLFANVEGASYGVASLGGLAFDAVSQQLFVVDRATGIIHRIGLDGVERGTYDHGTEGRPAAGLSSLPFVPGPPVDINSAGFDSEDTSTWGYASPARRTFGLGVRNNRLYYSVAQGPQIWSVGIAPNGALAGSPRFEAEVAALQNGVEIASIAFDGNGRMYLAERGPTTGDYEMIKLASGGQARVLRFVPKPAGDPAPGLWRLEPDQYAIGLPAPYNNANGGVALGYGYQQTGRINYGVCRATLWSTGERLLDPGDPSVPPDSYPAIDGLQGNSPSAIEPQNMPPLAAWFVDYDDAAGSPEYTGYMGAIAIYSPCAGQVTYVPPPPVITCPPGTVYSGGQCVVPVTCPPGTLYKNGACVYPSCPRGYVSIQGQCVPPPIACPPGFAFYNGKCVPLECPPGLKRMPNGQCICPVNNIWYNGRCVPPNLCPRGMVPSPNGVCWCPAGTYFENGFCAPNYCPRGYITAYGKCVPAFCPPGFIRGPLGACVPDILVCAFGEVLFNGRCIIKQCPPFQELDRNGKCRPIFKDCKNNEVVINGKCVPKKCPPFQELGNNGQCRPIVVDCKQGFKNANGKCVPIVCKADQKLVNGKCVDRGIVPANCKANEVFRNGKCVKVDVKPIECRADQRLVDGKCIDRVIVPKPADCKANEVFKNGRCVEEAKPIVCKADQRLVDGKCVNRVIVPKPADCKANEVFKNGKCVEADAKPIVCKADQRLVDGKCIDRVIVPKPPQCKANEVLRNGKCVVAETKKCESDQKLVNGKCVDATPAKAQPACKPYQELVSGQCVRKCGAGEARNKNGKCVVSKTTAPAAAPAATVQP